MKRNRAWRRKQEHKKKSKVIRDYHNWWGGDWDSRSVGLKSHTPKRCSCAMCGNPRKYFKEQTMQERKASSKIC